MKHVIVITGASSGFGALAARALAKTGHIVYASMRDTAGRNASQVQLAKQFALENQVDLRIGHWPEIPPHWLTAQRHLETYRRPMASSVAERLSLASMSSSNRLSATAELLKKASMPPLQSTFGPGTPRTHRSAQA